MMLNLVTLDRLLAMRYTFFYNRCSKRTCKVLICASLLTPAGFFVARILYNKDVNEYYMLSAVTLPLTILVIVTNFVTYNVVNRQICDIVRTIVANKTVKDQILRRLWMRKMRSATNCIFIVATTVIFFSPIQAVAILSLFCKSMVGDDVIIFLTHVAEMAVLMTTVKDALLYINLNREIKRQVVKVIKSKVVKSTDTWNMGYGRRSITRGP